MKIKTKKIGNFEEIFVLIKIEFLIIKKQNVVGKIANIQKPNLGSGEFKNQIKNKIIEKITINNLSL